MGTTGGGATEGRIEDGTFNQPEDALGDTHFDSFQPPLVAD